MEEESRVGEQRFMCGEGCSSGAEGNSQAYYRWDSPGRAGLEFSRHFQHISPLFKAPPPTESSALQG